MCGFQGIIFSSLIPTERGRLGSHSQKNFLPSKSRQREASFFTPVLNIPSLVPTGSGQKLCLFCNFLPSRGRARKIGFYALFSKIICFRLKIGVSYQLLKERGSKLAQIFACGIKIDAAFGSGISAVASKLMPF